MNSNRKYSISAASKTGRKESQDLFNVSTTLMAMATQSFSDSLLVSPQGRMAGSCSLSLGNAITVILIYFISNFSLTIIIVL